MGIFETIGSIGSAIAGGFNIVLQLIGLRNSPEMKKAKQAQLDKEKEDEINRDIANRNTDKAKRGQSS